MPQMLSFLENQYRIEEQEDEEYYMVPKVVKTSEILNSLKERKMILFIDYRDDREQFIYCDNYVQVKVAIVPKDLIFKNQTQFTKFFASLPLAAISKLTILNAYDEIVLLGEHCHSEDTRILYGLLMDSKFKLKSKPRFLEYGIKGWTIVAPDLYCTKDEFYNCYWDEDTNLMLEGLSRYFKLEPSDSHKRDASLKRKAIQPIKKSRKLDEILKNFEAVIKSPCPPKPDENQSHRSRSPLKPSGLSKGFLLKSSTASSKSTSTPKKEESSSVSKNFSMAPENLNYEDYDSDYFYPKEDIDEDAKELLESYKKDIQLSENLSKMLGCSGMKNLKWDGIELDWEFGNALNEIQENEILKSREPQISQETSEKINFALESKETTPKINIIQEVKEIYDLSINDLEVWINGEEVMPGSKTLKNRKKKQRKKNKKKDVVDEKAISDLERPQSPEFEENKSLYVMPSLDNNAAELDEKLENFEQEILNEEPIQVEEFKENVMKIEQQILDQKIEEGEEIKNAKDTNDEENSQIICEEENRETTSEQAKQVEIEREIENFECPPSSSKESASKENSNFEQQKLEIHRQETQMQQVDEVRSHIGRREILYKQYHYELEIEEDSIGHGYFEIFSRCLNETLTEVIVQDPWISEYFQIRNFALFCTILHNHAKKLKKISLITRAAQDLRNVNIQRKALQSITESLEKNGLEINIKYKDFHDREFRFNNGWKVIIGRGLDIYKKVELESLEYFNPNLRPCKATKVDYIRIQM
uniref:MITD1 C-terminal phospholipase D-like domain-containing protein n=2 Tax=Acrobeloides nanus TaxID=290746 RepID=A0A914C3Y6_9BILA